MAKTVILVTNQCSCDRIIYAARIVADETQTELNIIEVLDSEYVLNPQAIDYLFVLAKQNNAVMRIVMAEDKLAVIRDTIAARDVAHVVTGMPSSHNSILYDLWKEFPEKRFHVVDETGEIVEIVKNQFASA
jgi:Mg2+/Co2+ transporter CorC